MSLNKAGPAMNSRRQARDDRARRGGYLLLEMIAVVTIISIFLALAGPLYRDLVASTRDGGRAVNELASFDRMIGQLRADVWNSGSMELDSDRRLILRQTARVTVTWQLKTEDGMVERTRRADEGKAERRSYEATYGMRFEAGPTPASVHLTVNRAGWPAPRTLPLASQIQLIRRLQ